jgi:hypothetical protein
MMIAKFYQRVLERLNLCAAIGESNKVADELARHSFVYHLDLFWDDVSKTH